MIKTPVVYIVFNRPEYTQKSFDILRINRPTKLFIIADGPRPGNTEDFDRCTKVRTIVENVDWPCTVYQNYALTNLGLKNRVSSGLDWVFEQEEEAIVLEDDCLPHKDFFSFCDTLLDRYKDNKNIGLITGNNFQNNILRGDASYYFSKYAHCWGWATWRRSWLLYQGNIPFWREWRYTQDWKETIQNRVERSYWTNIFNKVEEGGFNSWAYPWLAVIWYNKLLTVTPNKNLVSNIGFDENSTNTKSNSSYLDTIPAHNLGVLKHPNRISQDFEADKFVFDNTFGGRDLRFPNRIFFYIKLIAMRFNKFINRKK